MRVEKRYRIIESDGIQTEEHEVVRREAYNEGFVLVYGTRDRPEFCYVPRGYRPIQENGLYLVAKNKGNVSAALWVGRSVDPDAPGDDMSMLARTHLMAMGYKSLYEQKVPWKLLAIGIVVLVAVVGVVMLIRGQVG